MSDLQAIGAALGGLKTAAELAKAFVDVKSAVDVQGKVFELQRVILAAQQDTFTAQQTQSALLAGKDELEERIRQLEAWDGEEDRYQLEAVGREGSLAYTLKPEAKGSEPDHHLCATCFQHRRKSFLQPHTIPEGRAQVLMCHECGLQIAVRGVPETRTVSTPNPRAGAFGR
jgi:hypothetical protein